MSVTAVRTPLAAGPVLALGNRRYRKEILKVGDVHYRGGTFPVTPDYIRKVVEAFDARAIPRVPFQLADAANAHTEDPLRRFGTIVALHQTGDGLDAVIELDEQAARLVDTDPDFGVSVLIKHDRVTGEGRRFDAVLAHVLGTTDPVLTSLRPWREELAAANPAEPGGVLDLLALTSDDTTPGGPTVADTLTSEETAALRSLASAAPQLVALLAQPATPVVQATAPAPPEPETPPTPGPTPVPPAPPNPPEPAPPADVDGDGAEFSDEELDAIAAAVDEPVVEVAAAHGDDALRLANEKAEAAELRLAQLEQKLAEKDFAAEQEHWAREYGITPHLTGILKPLLVGAGGQVALANAAADPGSLVRQFIRELAQTGRLDLSQPAGSALDGGAGDADHRASLVEAALRDLKVR